MKFEDILEIKNGRNQRAVENPRGKYPIYGSGGIMGYADDYICDAYTVIIGRKGNINNPIFVEEPFWNVDTAFGLSANTDVILPRFLYYFCKKFDFERLNKTVTIPSLTKSDLLKIEIEPPNLLQQRDIVERLTKIERIIALRKLELKLLDDLIRARFIELFGDVTSNPNRYPVKNFEEISVLITDGEYATPRRTEEGIYLLSARNVLNHALQLEDVDYIDDEEYSRIARRVIPQAGDVLISCSGSIGRCCVVPKELRFQMVRSVALIRFDSTINPVFAEWLIASDDLQQQIAQAATQSSQANLFQGKIRKLHGYVPPIELQEHFAAFVQRIAKSKAAVQKALDQAQLLFDSLMQEYFG